MIYLFVDMKPVPRQSVQKGKTRSGKDVFYQNKSGFEAYTHMVAQQNRPENPYSGPVGLICIWQRKKPQSAKKHELWPITRPDIDNHVKPVKDVFNNLIYNDDSQVVFETHFKAYGQPGVHIWLFEIGQKDNILKCVENTYMILREFLSRIEEE